MALVNVQVMSNANLLSTSAALTVNGLPPITPGSAVFLDFDGTLIELASQPDAIVVPPDLAALLARLSDLLGGALAVVSGRQLSELDHYLAPLELPTAAEHGAHCRMPSGSVIWSAAPNMHEVVSRVTLLASQHLGLQAEIKTAAVALHYRHAPQLQDECTHVLQAIVASTPGVELLHGKCVLEIKPAGTSKGTGIRAFMQQSPFVGRLPVFAGDDTTDETGFAAINALGGSSLKVGAGVTLAVLRCAAPLDVRNWLRNACLSLEGAAQDYAHNNFNPLAEAMIVHGANDANGANSAFVRV